MKSCCLFCKKDTNSTNSEATNTKNGRVILKSQCSVCGNKKSRFISEKEGSGILLSLGIRAPLNKVPLLGHLLF